MRNAFFTKIVMLLGLAIASAQNKNGIQQSALGVHFFINDFKNRDSQNTIKPGLALSFMTGISPHADFVAMLAGSFPALAAQNDHLLLETDAALRYKIFPGKYWISPFLQAGIGVSKYNSTLGTYLPAGIGVQIKLFEEAY